MSLPLAIFLIGAAAVAGLLIGRNNPTLAAAAAKYVASLKTDFDAAVAKVQAKLHR